jgi:hypothetical protein
MPQLKPETALRKKVEALERQKALADALITFIKSHPDIAADCSVHQLHGKVGLLFPDYALIVPTWKAGKLMLRLVKSGEDWINSMAGDEYYKMEKLVVEDVSSMSSDELEAVLDRIYGEANPDADEEEDSEE